MGYRERIESTEKRSGKYAAILRGRQMICSWTLGRAFNESADEYLASDPSKAAFIQWFHGYDDAA